MSKYLPFLCLFLALATLIGGFALLAVGSPEADTVLHRARASGDEQLSERLEEWLRERQWRRRALISGLFGATVLFVGAAFWTMSAPRREQS